MADSNRKKQILNGAARLFRKRGFTATSMRDIASDLQIEAPSLYNHIKGKQEILQILLLELAYSFTSGMEVIRNSALTYRERLERLIRLHVDLTIKHPNGMALLTSDWVHLEEPALNQYTSMRDEYELAFRNILIESFKNEGKESVNLDLALFSILSTLRWLFTWVLKNPEINPIVLEKEMIENLLSGIFRKSLKMN
ncbi:MAG: TetR/AcrR family transcriptional regulator [Flavobacteriales bacterium]|jgi:AcrR family transcriptional regulator